jgi:hypothetical protein
MCAPQARAGQVFAEVGEGRLRSDLQLLSDAGLINLIMTDWPIPVADIDNAIGRVNATTLTAPALRAAFERVQQAIQPPKRSFFHPVSARIAAGEPSLLRDFDTPARENGDVSVYMGAYGDRFAAEINLGYAFNPRDGQPVRLDGSNITARFGNWLFSVNTLDKWWGAGYSESLILSNNARPMPAFAIENALSTPIDLPILRWLGPWRFNMYFALLEGERPDVDNALFFGNRFTFKPVHFLEIGVSRGVQFCGDGRPCNATVFRNVLIGNYTTQYSGTENKPGHAQAGYEARLSSPWRAVPIAAYYQAIGNDEINRLPARLMKQLGVESWLELRNGDTVRGFLEYTDSTCGAMRDPPEYTFPESSQPCAYDNSVFFAGYRYRGLNVAASADANSILRAIGLRWVRQTGEEWQLKIESGHFNRGEVVNSYNPVSPSVSSLYDSAQIEWRRHLLGGTAFVQLGIERQQPAQAIGNGHGFGYLTWSKAL